MNEKDYRKLRLETALRLFCEGNRHSSREPFGIYSVDDAFRDAEIFIEKSEKRPLAGEAAARARTAEFYET